MAFWAHLLDSIVYPHEVVTLTQPLVLILLTVLLLFGSITPAVFVFPSVSLAHPERFDNFVTAVVDW